MRNPNDLWEAIGGLDAEETAQVLARLFTVYERLLADNSQDSEALSFFRRLDVALSQTTECNLNRR